MTHSEAETAFKNGSYKEASDETLREMHRACLDAGGLNQSAVSRIREIGNILWQELAKREKTTQDAQRSALLSGADSSAPCIVQSSSPAPSHSWDENKLLKLIQDRIEENLSIEYKSSGALSRESRKMAEITKDVSAMANSAGGLLIYGIAEFQDDPRKHLPERIDPINRNEFSKEWLEQVISQIRPRIATLQIHPVQLTSAANHVAYVVEIPQAATAHQATDCRYYRRYNFESVMMQDHEVRDVMSRKSHPRIQASAELVVYRQRNRDGEAGALVVNITNESDVFARYVAFVVHSPLRINNKLINYPGAIIDDRNEGTAYRLSFSNHLGAPLFPRGKLKEIFRFKWIDRMDPEPEKQLIHFKWVLFADSMPMQSGSWNVEDIIRKNT
jgi:hypothetical protein